MAATELEETVQEEKEIVDPIVMPFGKEVWIGNFSCVRPYGWKDHEILVTLNVDTAHKPAARNLHLTNESAPGKADSYTHSVLTGDGRRKISFN